MPNEEFKSCYRVIALYRKQMDEDCDPRAYVGDPKEMGALMDGGGFRLRGR